MAGLVRELVRRHSNRCISTIAHQHPSGFALPSCLPPSILGRTKFDDVSGLNPSDKGSRTMEEVAHFSKFQIYPSFSFGCFLDPIILSGLGPSQLVNPNLEHPGMMWADSVKKKRKKKMNKHKYKKLRKRLRRKTKT